MPFGLGLFEILLVIAVTGAPIGLIFLGVRALSRRSAPDRHLEASNRHLEAELDSAHRRTEEMEVKLLEMEERLSFTHNLLEGRRSEP